MDYLNLVYFWLIPFMLVCSIIFYFCIKEIDKIESFENSIPLEEWYKIQEEKLLNKHLIKTKKRIKKNRRLRKITDLPIFC